MDRKKLNLIIETFEIFVGNSSFMVREIKAETDIDMSKNFKDKHPLFCMDIILRHSKDFVEQLKSKFKADLDDAQVKRLDICSKQIANICETNFGFIEEHTKKTKKKGKAKKKANANVGETEEEESVMSETKPFFPKMPWQEKGLKPPKDKKSLF
jgi:hypothetical protein